MGDDLKMSLALAGGPKPCSDAGPRTVIVIWRDDFRICTHLFFYENFGCVLGFWGFVLVVNVSRGFLFCFGLVSVERIPEHTHRNTKPKGKRKKERKTDVGKGREHKYKREMAIEGTNKRTRGLSLSRALLNEKESTSWRA
jgi:hypothetical protein